MKLRIAEPAKRQIARLQKWWVANRPVVRTLFMDELDETLQLIRETPGVGSPWPTRRRPTLRRIQMSRTHNHIYFRVDEKMKTVFVLAVWGGPRGTTPKL